MTFTPLDFQRADLDRLRANGYRALLNIATGGGKTPLSAFAIKESNADVALVIAPAQTHEDGWIPTLQSILDHDVRVIGNKNKATKQALSDLVWGYPGTYVCTPEFFTRADVSSWRGDFLVGDEAHKLVSPRTKAQRKLSGVHPSDGEPLALRFDGRLLLSGTPLRNRFELAWGVSKTLWPEYDARGEVAHSNFYLWQADRMNYKEVYTNQRDQWGNAKKVKQYLSESIPGKWLSECPCVITHAKRERCCEFHPNGFLNLSKPTEIHERIELLPAQRKAIAELEAISMTFLESNPLVTEIPLTQAQRIRQLTLGVPTVSEDGEVDFDVECKSPIIDRVIEYLTEDLSDEPVMIYTESQKFASVVTERLNRAGIPAFEYSGKTRGVRDQQAREFGTTYRAFVGVLAAIAEGYDGAQRVAKTEFWLNRSLDETINEQGMGRLDRMGQTGQVLRIIFHDDAGISEGRYSEALERRMLLNRSLRNA